MKQMIKMIMSVVMMMTKHFGVIFVAKASRKILVSCHGVAYGVMPTVIQNCVWSVGWCRALCVLTRTIGSPLGAALYVSAGHAPQAGARGRDSAGSGRGGGSGQRKRC